MSTATSRQNKLDGHRNYSGCMNFIIYFIFKYFLVLHARSVASVAEIVLSF